MSKLLGYAILLLAVVFCIEAAPHSHEKDSSRPHESESIEAETKETKESSEERGSEEDSDYQDTEPHSKEKKYVMRDWLRPLRLPETYGIPDASQNPDMIPLYDILAREGTPVKF